MSVASLDLEQEQLTIKALKELSERQVETLQDRIESPSEEILKQTFTFAPEYSQPQRSHDVLEHTDVKTGSDLGISEKPTVIKETTSIDFISSLNKTELVNKHVLARLLTDFSEGLSSLCSDEPPSEIRTSSFFASSEMYNTDLTILHGEQSRELGSQPVLAKEGKGKGYVALLDVKTMEKPQGTSEDGANSPVSVAEGSHCNHPSIPASFPDRPAFLSEVVQMEEQINKDQDSKNPNEIPSRDDKTALDAGDKFILLTAQKPPTEQSKAEGVCTYSLSPGKVSGGGVTEKDSPESPFEVIIDKAAFDKEFKDAYKESANDFGSWAMHTDRESSADISESNDKVFPLRTREAGCYPTSALLTRTL